MGDFERKEATSLLVNELTGCFIRCKFCMVKTSWTSSLPAPKKRSSPPIPLGQDRQGEASRHCNIIHIVPLYPAYLPTAGRQGGACGARSGQEIRNRNFLLSENHGQCSSGKRFIHPISTFYTLKGFCGVWEDLLPHGEIRPVPPVR